MSELWTQQGRCVACNQPWQATQQIAALERRLAAAEDALRELNAASDGVHREIVEFDRPVSSERFERWQDAMKAADAVLSQSK